jgi:hypothetical protein
MPAQPLSAKSEKSMTVALTSRKQYSAILAKAAFSQK